MDNQQLLKTQIDALSSLLLDVQQECITQRCRADAYEQTLRSIAEPVGVPVHTKRRGGIDYKRMYKAWRLIAPDRIDAARAVLKGSQQND